MKNKKLKQELVAKYSEKKKQLSDPLELLDMVVNCHGMIDKDKTDAVEMAEEIYFGYNQNEHE